MSKAMFFTCFLMESGRLIKARHTVSSSDVPLISTTLVMVPMDIYSLDPKTYNVSWTCGNRVKLSTLLKLLSLVVSGVE